MTGGRFNDETIHRYPDPQAGVMTMSNAAIAQVARGEWRGGNVEEEGEFRPRNYNNHEIM